MKYMNLRRFNLQLFAEGEGGGANENGNASGTYGKEEKEDDAFDNFRYTIRQFDPIV